MPCSLHPPLIAHVAPAQTLGVSPQVQPGVFLLRVRFRLKADWPKSRARIDGDSSLFDFKDEATRDLDIGTQLLTSREACKQKEGFDLLRKSFLLDPNPSKAAKIASIYRNSGYEMNAAFFDSMHLSPGPLLLKEARTYPNSSVSAGAFRYIFDHSLPETKDALSLALESSDTATFAVGAQEAYREGKYQLIDGHLNLLFRAAKTTGEQQRVIELAYRFRDKINIVPMLTSCIARKIDGMSDVCANIRKSITSNH